MRQWRFIPVLLISLLCAIGHAQPAERIAFSDLIEALATPRAAEVPQLTDLIKSRGIAFELTPQTLGSIVSNSIKAGRNPDQVAALILASFQACQECRARGIAPLTKDELKTLFTWGFSDTAILEEARVRGMADLEVSSASAEELRKFGAKDDLINLLMPDDKMPTTPPEGEFKKILLRRAEGYNPAALRGWVNITAEFPAKSQSELIFKHNALFSRAIGGEGPNVDLENSSFNKPGPRNTNLDLLDYYKKVDNVDQKTSRFGGPGVVDVSVDYVPADKDPDGRNAFRIHVANKLNKPQRCLVYVEWTVRTTPKTTPSNTKP